jgi:hypothetical protein
MSRFVIFSSTQGCLHDKFDFITKSGVRYGCDSPYAYDGMVIPQKTTFVYLEANPYGGITSLLDKLNGGDESVADVQSSDKWLIGEVDIFYKDKKTIRILPVHSVRNGTSNRWEAIIDTAFA